MANSKWGKFANIDAKALNQEAENLPAGNFEEVPLGKYEVSIDSMELGTSKEKGYPMLKVCFNILKGDYQGRKVFYNQVICMGDDNDKFRLHTANEFLRSLETSQDVTFEGFDQYEALIDKIAAECDKENFEYLLEIGERKGYRQYHIKEAY